MNRKIYINKFDRKLKEWDKEIAKLEKRAESITKTLHQRIDELKEHRDHAATKTSDLLQSSEDAWIEVKYGAEEALNDLKKAFKKARGKFK
jgi:flagellar hook-basal body complex protein FliE